MSLRVELLGDESDGSGESGEQETGAVLGSPWPAGAREQAGRVVVGGVDLGELAERFGTPVYVLDEAEFRARAAAYVRALPGGSVHYAAKAFFSPTVARWVREEGLGVDVCSANELALALDAGVEPERIVLHGVAKTHEELESATREHVGRIVIDGFTEIAHLSSLAFRHRPYQPQGVYVRVIPGIAVGHHEAVRTGTEDQQFGLSVADGSAPGAYQLSMSSAYNLVGRPPLVSVRDGVARLIQRRETLADLTAREGAWG